MIDYKNSIQDKDKFGFNGFETLFNDTEYNKQLQLFIYVWLIYKNKPEYLKQIQPGIIPFRKFLKKPKQIVTGKDKQNLIFDAQLMEEFESHLATFIGSILDLSRPFEQAADKDICKFCDYRVICNR